MLKTETKTILLCVHVCVLCVMFSDLSGYSGAVADTPSISPVERSPVRKLFDTWLRDTSICLGPENTYYLTGTTQAPGNNRSIRLWRSTDLEKWEPLGVVWEYGSSPWHKDYLRKKKPLWAPEIHYLKGTFWLTYSIPGWDDTPKTSGCGLLKSATGKAEGPYVDVQPDDRIGDEIDASLFQDTDGSVYFVWHSGKIARMKDDMSGLAEPYHWLKMTGTDPAPNHHSGLCEKIFGPNSFDHVGYEGATMFKANGRYYLAAAENNDGHYDCMVAESENIYGPYGQRYMAVRDGGHVTFFHNAQGAWWSTFFGNDKNAPQMERPGIVPLEFDAEGHVKTKKNPEGAGVFGAYAPSKDYTPPKDPAVLQNLSEWQDQKLGLLLTWGIYSQWGIVESWTLCPERYEWNKRTGPYANDDRAYKASYEELVNTFSPVKFDPARWAAAFKDGGVKYVLVMAKHHDGFCMFDTATSDYRITSPRCPFHTDPRANVLKEMSAAFRKEGLSTGVYFSKADWNSPYYWSPDFPLRDRNVNYDTSEHPDLWDKFKDFTWRQIEELMSGYGPQDVLWLDGGQVRPPDQDIDPTGMAAMARKHQRGLIVVDRTVRGENENYVTPEQEIPDHYLPYPWETCMTMGTAWPWKPNDQFKSAGTLIRTLCTIVARGGNLLLGIGPDANGEFDPSVYSRLEEMGRWLKLNGEAIYETRPIAPYEKDGCVFTQKRDNTVYAIILPKDDNGGLPELISLPKELAKMAGSLTLLGYGSLQVGANGTVAIPPSVMTSPPCSHAWAMKIAPR